MAVGIARDQEARFPLAVAPIGSILPFVGHALGGQAKRARPIKKRAEISLPSPPLLSALSSMTSECTISLFLAAITLITIRPDRIIGLNEKRSRRSRGSAKRSIKSSRTALQYKIHVVNLERLHTFVLKI